VADNRLTLPAGKSHTLKAEIGTLPGRTWALSSIQLQGEYGFSL